MCVYKYYDTQNHLCVQELQVVKDYNMYMFVHYCSVILCSHDANDVARRELVATDSTTNNVEEIVADLVHIILLEELYFTLYKYDEHVIRVGEHNHKPSYYNTLPLMLGSQRKASRVIRARLSQWLV